MSNKLIVGGTFDTNGGKPSKIVARLADSLGSDWSCINGGHIDVIKQFSPLGKSVLLWMPNVSNDEDKIIDNLKQINPHMILIQSKRVVEKEYRPSDVVGRLLKSHSLLGIMITKQFGVYNFSLLDPLGNIWASTTKVELLGKAINSRIDTLTSMKRVGSIRKTFNVNSTVEQEFVDVVKAYGSKFSTFVEAANPYRLLGNASTRCAKGFPAVRLDDCIMVSRRNVDKETLCSGDFVPVKPHMDKYIQYTGDFKPSVDAPIQIKLFDYYKNVKYMIHGHAYVLRAFITEHKIPCGFIEEFDDITSIIPDPNTANFCINLRGHGCLILANDIEYLHSQLDNLVARPFPEQ